MNLALIFYASFIFFRTSSFKDANADKIEELSDDPEDDGIYENLSNMYALHKDEPPQQQHRRVAIDIYHFILASQASQTVDGVEGLKTDLGFRNLSTGRV